MTAAERPPFVDTHVHFWDLEAPRLRYSWLEPEWVHPVLGNIDAIKVPQWLPEHLRLETLHANVSKVVHVQCALDSVDPVEETRWLEAAFARTGGPDAIIAYADLKDPEVERVLHAHAEASPRFRGIRDFSSGDFLVDPGFRRGGEALAELGLALEIEVTWEDMDKAARLAAAIPELTVLIDHAGFPRQRTDEYFQSWRAAVERLGEVENVLCKVSGLGMCDNEWTTDSLRPWVLTAVESFGPERCMLGTNWPVDKLYSTYDALIDAYEEILSGFGDEERAALFHGTAERVLRI